MSIHRWDVEETPVAVMCMQWHIHVINVIGFGIIRDRIVKEVKEVRFFSVFTDEVSNQNVEHLALCLSFIDLSEQMRKEFVSWSFLKMGPVRAVDIEEAIAKQLTDIGLSFDHLRKLGYVGWIHYDELVDADEVCQLFLQKHPRRIEESSMLCENSST